jgi:hypothetical protein
VDLETVLTTIVAKATQLSSTEAGAIYVFDDANQGFRLRATYGLDDAVVAVSVLARLRSAMRSNSECRSRLETFGTTHWRHLMSLSGRASALYWSCLAGH